MTIRLFKNQTDSNIYINDLGAKLIPANGQIDLAECYTLTDLSNSKDLITALTTNIVDNYSTYLILNDGNQDLIAVDAVDLIRNIAARPTISNDGDWKMVIKNPSLISTNQIIDKHFSYCIAPLETVTKKIKIPNGKIWFIENFGGSSDQTCAQLTFNYKDDNNITINPFVDACTDYDLTTTQAIGANDTTIYVDNTNNELNWIKVNHYYQFENEDDTDSTALYRKITAVDKQNDTITINSSLGTQFESGSYICLAEKCIRNIMVEKLTNVIPFGSPIRLTGTAANYISLSLKNTDKFLDSKIFIFFNGWEEPAE